MLRGSAALILLALWSTVVPRLFVSSLVPTGLRSAVEPWVCAGVTVVVALRSSAVALRVGSAAIIVIMWPTAIGRTRVPPLILLTLRSALEPRIGIRVAVWIPTALSVVLISSTVVIIPGPTTVSGIGISTTIVISIISTTGPLALVSPRLGLISSRLRVSTVLVATTIA
jgi:hypothetical protein